MIFISRPAMCNSHFALVQSFTPNVLQSYFDLKAKEFFMPEPEGDHECLLKCYSQIQFNRSNQIGTLGLQLEKNPSTKKLWEAIKTGDICAFHEETKIPFFGAVSKEELGQIKGRFIYILRGHARVAHPKTINWLRIKDRVYDFSNAGAEETKSRHYFADIETIFEKTSEGKDQIPYLIYLYSETEEIYFWGKDCPNQFAAWLEAQDAQDQIIIWTFNGAKFDLILLMRTFSHYFYPEIKGTPTNIKMLVLNGHIHFYDLRLIFIQGNLDKLAELFKLPNKKGKMEYEKFTEQYFEEKKKEIVEYCQNDCKITAQLFKIMGDKINAFFAEFGRIPPFTFAISLPSLTMKLYKCLFFKEKELFGTENDDLYAIERSAYFGGICLNLKKEFKGPGKLYYYDINSSYPFAMLSPMPWKFIVSNPNPGNDEILDTNLYCISYEIDSIFPCLPFRDKGRLFYFQKGEKEWHWGIEIKLLSSMKKFLKLEVHQELIYEAKPLFRSYMQYLYEKRKNSKSDDEKYWYKILMNSFYGKFGQKDYDDTYYLPSNCVWEADLFTLSKEPHITFLDDSTAKVSIKSKKKNHIGRMVRFASYITAAGRSNLMRYIYQIGEEKIYYCDTDSFVSTQEFTNGVGKELGQIKLEKIITKGEFLAPKLYRFYDSDEVPTMKMKGVKNPIEFFSQEEKEDRVVVNKGTFKRRWGGITIINQEKRISAICGRRIWKNNDSFPFNCFQDYLKTLN